jgi:hypothetical protein
MVSVHSRSNRSSYRTSPHSVGETPMGNHGSNTSDGDRRTHPRAEFRGKKVEKPLLYYQPSHGPYTGLLAHPKGKSCNELPYARREAIPLDKRRGDVVTLADAHVIRQRNLPLIFSIQLKDVGRHRGPPILKQVYSILFPEGHRYKVQDPKHRPKAGCIQTKFWDDNQVQTWGKFANSYGVRYSGRTEYSFPKGLLGRVVNDGVYTSKTPWPDTKDPGPLQTVYLRPRRRIRSELSRVKRSIKRRMKDFVSKPLEIGQVIGVRKILSRKEIDRRYDHSCPISQFRERIPNCLSIKFGPPAQVSQIVLDSVRRIYSTPKKFLDDLSWLVPKGKPVEVTLRMKMAPRMEPSPKNRLIAMLTTMDGGSFYAMHTTGHRLELLYTDMTGDKASAERSTIRDKMFSWQDKLDENPDEYSAGEKLGGWFD